MRKTRIKKGKEGIKAVSEKKEPKGKGIIGQAADFFKSDFNKLLVILLLVLGTVSFFYIGAEEDYNESEGLAVRFFYLPTCPHCTEQKPIYEEVKAEYPDIKFYSIDASSSEGSALFYKMATEAGLDTSKLGVPAIFVGKKALIGFHTKEEIVSFIDECRNECKNQNESGNASQGMNESFSDYELPFIGRVDLTSYSLPVLAMVLGLIDGFNPCAMWVLVYLIALLIEINDRKKIWLIVGTFVLASGVLYFLFMTAWLNIFLLVGYIRIITILIGLLALGGGILSLKEYYTTKGDLTCKVGDEESHEKTMGRMQKIVSQPLSIPIFFSIVALAFVVNSVEFVCSAAIPAVFTQILTLSNLAAWQSYAYIGLYVFFFMLDDLIIFGMAAFAVGSSYGEKYAKSCKLFGGIIMAILGIIMLFAPHLLR